MPDEEQRRPSQQPTEGERTSTQRDSGIREATVQDGEILKASGARPSPNPNPAPTEPEGPVNRAVEFPDGTRHETPIVGDSLSETRTESAPPPPPLADSNEGEA